MIESIDNDKAWLPLPNTYDNDYASFKDNCIVVRTEKGHESAHGDLLKGMRVNQIVKTRNESNQNGFVPTKSQTSLS